VVRKLTPTELMHCLDILGDIRAAYAWQEPSEYGKLPFSRAVPTKVLFCVLGRVYPSKKISSLDPPHRMNRPEVDQVSVKAAVQQPNEQIRQKAAKNDDATVDFEFWDGPFIDKLLQMGRPQSFGSRLRGIKLGARHTPVFDVLREFILHLWRQSVHRSFCRYMRMEHGVEWTAKRHPDITAGRDCLTRAAGASFWDWSARSRLFFWHWPPESRKWARDGHPVYVTGDLPHYKKVQPLEPDLTVQSKVKEKFEKFFGRGYITKGRVESLISYFTTPKGESDVRLVFDGTKSRLNSVLWAPSFHLPTVESLLPSLTPGAWQGDIDIGEMFYNYSLDPAIQAYCGVDVHPYLSTPNKPRLAWMYWGRCVMGLRSSPHGCVKMHSLVEEIIHGDTSVSSNPFALLLSTQFS